MCVVRPLPIHELGFLAKHTPKYGGMEQKKYHIYGKILAHLVEMCNTFFRTLFLKFQMLHEHLSTRSGEIIFGKGEDVGVEFSHI